MAFFSQSELEARTGYGYGDFLQNGVAMTAEQWAALVTSIEAEVRQAICTFCRRQAFEVATYTAYHDGSGPTGERREFTARDLLFIPREQPVVSITSISEDVGEPNGVISWVERIARSDSAGGDYSVLQKGRISVVRFHSNVPRKGEGNVKIVYSAGYASGSPVLSDLKGIALEMAGKILGIKKRRQEAAAARTSGTRDAADMVPIGDPKVLNDDTQTRPLPYRRERAGGRAWR